MNDYDEYLINEAMMAYGGPDDRSDEDGPCHYSRYDPIPWCPKCLSESFEIRHGRYGWYYRCKGCGKGARYLKPALEKKAKQVSFVFTTRGPMTFEKAECANLLSKI